ncbi:MAG: hypothetical protein U0X20_21550 [Caldilineaceae bacterium]
MTTNSNLDDGNSDPCPELTACLQRDFNVHPRTLRFRRWALTHIRLSIGLWTPAGAAYFLKLRSADFNLAVVAVPHWLAEQSIPQIIAPIPCRDGRLFAQAGAPVVILYPFVAGSDGFAVLLQEQHWVELGHTLRRIHAAALPADLAMHIPREDYSPAWRTKVRRIRCQQRRNPARHASHCPNDAAIALHAFLRDRLRRHFGPRRTGRTAGRCGAGTAPGVSTTPTFTPATC